MGVVYGLIIIIIVLGLVLISASARVVNQFEQGVVFRLGRVTSRPRGPGLALMTPFIDRMVKVNMQIITLPVPAQDGITRDNVTVRVDAVVYYKVVDAERVAVEVQDYRAAIAQVAQTSLRSIIGKSDLDDLLSNRERLNEGLELMIDSPALGWGVHIDRVEIKDVALPESMKRSMSRQAEAERERRARVITADGELQASAKLSQAATAMAATPTALQLRLLQTVVEVAAEKNSTLVLPFPVELLRFLERNTPDENPSPRSGTGQANTGPAGTGQANTGPAGTGQANTEIANTGQANTGQAHAEHAGAEQAHTTAQAATGDGAASGAADPTGSDAEPFAEPLPIAPMRSPQLANFLKSLTPPDSSTT